MELEGRASADIDASGYRFEFEEPGALLRDVVRDVLAGVDAGEIGVGDEWGPDGRHEPSRPRTYAACAAC